MPEIELTFEQVLDLVRQLSEEEKHRLLLFLTSKGSALDEVFLMNRLHSVAKERGRDWENMNQKEQERFINELVDEDRKTK
jgi:hypothetical protein